LQGIINNRPICRLIYLLRLA